MYKMKIDEWTTKIPNNEGKLVERKESFVDAIKVLINGAKQEDLPQGIENFQIMHKIAEAFDNYEVSENKELCLEKREYEFIRKLLEKNIPAQWGLNKKLSAQINNFLELKEEE